MQEHTAVRTFLSFGDTYFTECPVCEGEDIHSVLKIPFGKGDFANMPVHHSTFIHEYYYCRTCDTTFKNPNDSTEHKKIAGPTNTWAQQKVIRAKENLSVSHCNRYERYIAPHIPKESTMVIDAACGTAEYLRLLHKDPTFTINHLIGFDIASVSVGYVNELGFEGRQVDLKEPKGTDDLLGKADFIIFAEAFEHVAFPLRVLQYLLSLLKPGGRIWFSVQRVSPELTVKPFENYCLTEKSIDVLVERLGCEMVWKCGENNGLTWLVLIQK